MAEHDDGQRVLVAEAAYWPEAVWSKPGTWTLTWFDPAGVETSRDVRTVFDGATGPPDVLSRP